MIVRHHERFHYCNTIASYHCRTEIVRNGVDERRWHLSWFTRTDAVRNHARSKVERVLWHDIRCICSTPIVVADAVVAGDVDVVVDVRRIRLVVQRILRETYTPVIVASAVCLRDGAVDVVILRYGAATAECHCSDECDEMCQHCSEPPRNGTASYG